MRLNYTGLNKELILFKINQEPSFANVFKNDLTEKFYHDINSRIYHHKIKDHIVMTCQGTTGTFKSSMMIEIARKYDPNFSSKQIAFTNQELIESLNESTPNQFFIRDEQVKDFGVGSQRSLTEIHIFSETLRARQNSFIFISPSYMNFPAHYTLETFKGNYDYENNLGALALKDVDTRRYIGGIIVKIDIDNDVWLQYKKRKDAFLSQVVTSDFRTFDIEKAGKKVFELKDFSTCNNSKEVFILVRNTYPHLTKGEQELITAHARKLSRG